MTGSSIISVARVSKSFRVPHERYWSLRTNAIHLFRSSSYTVLRALQDISFDVPKGQFVGIVGRNGSGKSTLLKLLAGIYLPNVGKVVINGSLSPFIELGVGFNPELTARENVFLNGVILGLTREEVAARFDEIIAFGDLAEFVDQKIKNFSSGMQVRLAFSVAIQAQSDILLIDEVLAVGDANFQTKCLNVFRDLKREGKTIVFVSHDMAMVQEFCDRAIVIERGQVVFDGDPRQAASDYLRLTSEEYPIDDDVRTTLHAEEAIARVVDAWINEEHHSHQVVLDRSADTYDVSIRVRFTAPTDEPVPGVIVYNSAGQRITASNTRWIHSPTGHYVAGEEATFTFHFPNVLEAGVYRVSANVLHSDLSRVFDWREDMVSFYCPRDFPTGGVINPPYTVTISRR